MENGPETFTTRGYQQEMLEESLRRNIIVAMDTGSGKTHIAVLRLKIEAERETRKVSWFFAPNVALCEQQYSVIRKALPVPVTIITGASEPNQWKDQDLWRNVLRDWRVVVSTPQVLLDALRHGYIVMGRDISLMIFDEAHHASDKHPYNLIMQEFYFNTPRRSQGTAPDGSDFIQPMIMGLSASPIFGGNVDVAFRKIEGNLDSTICAPRRHRGELSEHVHRPIFKHILYETKTSFSTNLAALDAVVSELNIENDPYVKSLRKDLAKASAGSADYDRIDRKLSKVIHKQDSFTHKGLRDFSSAAHAILDDVGTWATDWFVWEVIQQAKLAAGPLRHVMKTWKVKEKVYLLSILDKISVMPPSYAPEDIAGDSSDKIAALIECLLHEKELAEDENEMFVGLVFVHRRDVVLALKELLSNHPVTAPQFRVGSLLGTSESSHRHSMMDITRRLAKDTQDDTLMDFKIGEKNLIVSTAVAEEGIDVQACGCVIRWDLPPNMASWAQSRGRARKKRSTFTLMFEKDSGNEQNIMKWQNLEQEMVARYYDVSRIEPIEPSVDDTEEDGWEFRIGATGASLTLQSAIPHLNHFCAVVCRGVEHKALFELEPPEYPLGWHSFSSQSQALMQYQGPWASTVTLPRFLPAELRVFSAEMIYMSKVSAHRHAAFQAYRCLYEHGLLNEHLLPIIDDDEEVRELKKAVEQRMSTVAVSKQMDPWTVNDETLSGWYWSELIIGDLPPLHFFSRMKPTDWSSDNGLVLHTSVAEQMVIQLRSIGTIEDDDRRIIDARGYTFLLFYAIYGSRMEANNLDFSYLLLPVEDSREPVWEQRASRMSTIHPSKNLQDIFNANASVFGEQFGYPTDIVFVRDGTRFSRPYKFVRWRFESEPLSVEEEEKIRSWKCYAKEDDLEVAFPLLVVEPFPRRTNFLVPFPTSAKPTPPAVEPILLIAKLSTIIMLSPTETQYALLLPSILRGIAIAVTVESLRTSLFCAAPLSEIPNDILKVAITAPVSQEPKNYQRLETLGDTVLKFIVSIQLFDEYPLFPEGYLTMRKDHSVSNTRLAKENMEREVFRWVIRDRILGKKWKPNYMTSKLPETSAPILDQESAEASAANTEGMRKKCSKILADVIESLIGAAYFHGGSDLAYEATKFFDLGLKQWQPLPTRIRNILGRADRSELNELQLPEQVTYVETIIGHVFKRKLLLVEALTHASHQQDLGTVSYERMEFLGDAVLEMIVNDYLYRAPGKEYSPGHIYLRKVAVVNGHILAFICLKASLTIEAGMPGPDENGAISVVDEQHTVHLFKCLLHSSTHILEEQDNTWARFRIHRQEIEENLSEGQIFPWAALTQLQAPKFFADMIESIIGAVYLDTEGDLEVVRSVLRNLGLMQILERIVREGIDVLHPVSRLSMWAAKKGKRIEYHSSREHGNVCCSILIDEEEVARVSANYHGNTSKEEVRLAAAEKAIKVLHLRDVGANYNILKRTEGR
ncbi:rna helicase rnase [Moniliophthora roreri MCA 2997]|uniref:Rna helicase rnase n=1 Tax=Moniliophthora roreri (strain MCA 2997) TaxID=1381753 RepID=V2XH37_MONRO|nr:rna helicase rnase [Moniliophthora roreri MCA 2997]